MRVLVTGSAGRLGRSVVTSLVAHGHDVVGVDRVVDDAATTPSRAVDLTDRTACLEVVTDVAPEAIVHLAAIAVPFSRPEAEILAVNTAMAMHVSEAAVATGVASLVLASSPTVMGYGRPDDGWTPEYLPLDEDHPVEPWHAYALSKVMVEELGRMLARSADVDVTVTTVRPCFVISPEEWSGAATQSGHTVVERLDDPTVAGTSLFNYVDARDVGDLVHLVVTAPRTGPGRLPSGEVLFASAPDALSRAPLAEALPALHPGWADVASGLTGTEPAFSSDRARRLLGWEPSRTWRTELDTTTPDRTPERGSPT